MAPITSKFSRAVESPALPNVPAWEKAFWFLTRGGRARRHLLLAHKHPDDPQRIESVEKDSENMLGSWDKLADTEKTLLEQLFYYQAWRSLSDSQLGKAAEALGQLDGVAPSAASVPPLRLSLMEALWANGDANGFLDQAERFLADSRATEEQYTSDVLASVDRVYSRMGIAKCRDLLAKTHRNIRRRESVRSAIALCDAPLMIERRSDAEPINVGSLDFSALMQADGHLLNARLAECEGHVDAMLSSCQVAHKLFPEYQSAHYWLVRANLHHYSLGTDPATHLLGGRWPESAAWERLKRLAGLYRNLGIDSVVDVIPILRDELGIVGAVEARLAAELIRLAFEDTPEATSRENLEFVAEVCAIVEHKIEPLPWTQYFVAYKEALLEGAYPAARSRLESGAALGYERASRLLRVVRIMCGAPSAISNSGIGEELTVAETVMHALLAPPPTRSRWDFGVLLQRFEAFALEPEWARFPEFSTVMELLESGLQAVAGDRSAARQVLNSCRPAVSAPTWLAWMHARLTHMTEDVIPSDKIAVDADDPGDPNVSGELGPLLDAACERESTIRSRWMSARSELVKGVPQRAVDLLNTLVEEMDSVSAITAAWWRPLTVYWLGVAYAYCGSDRAAPTLEPLIGGIRGDEAAGQLALIDLQRGDAGAAMQRLEGASDRIPAVRYARALSLARMGRSEEARQLIGTEEATSSLAGSPYANAAGCLIAAIHERGGDREVALRLYEEVLARSPGDEVATLRLVRHHLRKAYVDMRVPGASIDMSRSTTMLLSLVPRTEAGRTQEDSYMLLTDFMEASSPESLAQLPARAYSHDSNPERMTWWRQLCAARYLNMGDPVGAGKVLDSRSRDFQVPSTVARAQAILGIWDVLHDCVHGGIASREAAALESHVRTLEFCGADDAVASSWRNFAQIALCLMNGESVASQRWNALGDFPMSHVASLFDSEIKARRTAAEGLMPFLGADNSTWMGNRKLLLIALAAWAMEKDDLFIQCYEALEPVIERLPVAVRDLWVPAALIHFSKENWKGLSGVTLPDSIADLSDPLVALIVELAEARAAIGDLKNPTMKVAQRFKSIHNNLAALIDRLSPKVGEAGAPGNDTV